MNEHVRLPRISPTTQGAKARMRARTATAAIFATVLVALAATPASACRYRPGPFQQAIAAIAEQCKHPLCGRLIVTDETKMRRGTSCDGDPFMAFGSENDWTKGGALLLGEVHDNPVHHTLRAAFFRAGSGATPWPTVGTAAVFEHIRADQQEALASFDELARNGQHIGSAHNLLRFLKWDETGWPDKAMFEPLFKSVLDAKLPILAGDPPRDKVRSIAKGGAALPGEGERRSLKLDTPLASKLNDALLSELEASHCGLVPKSAFTSMADAQRFRDAHLADKLLKAAEKYGSAVLLAGNGHVRSDRGVPHYLRQMAPGKKLVTVQFLEVIDGKSDPGDYFPRDPDGKPAVDYIVFTPRANRKDPCVEMRARFGKKT